MHAAGGRLGYVREAVCVACMREPSGVVMGTGVARGVMLWTGEPWRGKKCEEAPVSGIGWVVGAPTTADEKEEV